MAGVTPTSICNIALRRIGAKRIGDFAQEESLEAEVCRDLYDPARRLALSLHYWNGAKRTAQLVEATSDGITPDFYTFAYTIPTDFIRLISLHPSNDLLSSVPYDFIKAGSKPVIIACDSNEAWLQYVFDNTDMNSLSPGFHDMLAFVMCRDLAQALGKSAAAFEVGSKEYKRALSNAKSVDGMQNFPERLAQGSWIKSRFGRYTDDSIPRG